METTIKIVLKNTPLSNGNYPLYLRVIQNKVKKEIRLKLQCKEENFIPENSRFTKQHPNHKTENLLLADVESKALRVIRDFEVENIDFSLDDFVNTFRGEKRSNNIDVFNFFEEITEDLIKSNRIGNADTYKDTKNALLKFHKQYCNNKNLYFKDVTPMYIEKFEVFMKSRGNEDGGIAVKMRTLRALINKAISRKLISKDLYPFNDYKLSKLKGKGTKKALSIDEFQKIKNLDLTGYPHLVEAHNYFIFSFYARGINFVDMMKLRWSDIQDNKLYYIRSKTKGNFKMEVNEKMQEILDYYKAQNRPTDYVFPILLKENLTSIQIENRKHKILDRVNNKLKKIAELAEVNKHITTYSARHSYATISKFLGTSTDIISECMGHSNVQITETYLKAFDSAFLDEANRKLMDI